jgi:hypothetical protein
MIICTGKNNISATVICDSVNANGIRMTTLELEYPRFILAELNTHRMLSKNSASSRAIPAQRMRELIKEQPATPTSWGRNRSGMSANTELDEATATSCRNIWQAALATQCAYHSQLEYNQLHKQIANRLLEPWQMVKSVVSGTEWANLLYLRDHADAQPEFAELAQCIRSCLNTSSAQLLLPGEWHLPYVDTHRGVDNTLQYCSNDEIVPLETARMISASCCAQVSYRRTDTGIDKAQQIFYKLIESDPPHCSPVEHQATPLHTPHGRGIYNENHTHWQAGVTHMDAKCQLWSGNLRGWVQFRKLLPREAKW